MAKYGNPIRDMVGYLNNQPNPCWPNGAKIAVQFVVNYEEGAESNILHGDSCSEKLLSEIVGAESYTDMRNLNMESLYEYGSRVGIWRILDIFTKLNVPATAFACSMALERNPSAAVAMVNAGWEIASHGYRWIDYMKVNHETERNHIEMAVEIHTKICGTRPLGLYQGKPSTNSRRLIVEEGGFLYDSDSYNDELPYWNMEYGRPHLVIPYTLDANDMRFATPQGFNTGDQFFTYLKDTFDRLYKEGVNGSSKMMSIGLHCRLVGRPGRAVALEKFLEYILSFEKVWIAKRMDIAHHWYKKFYPLSCTEPLKSTL